MEQGQQPRKLMEIERVITLRKNQIACTETDNRGRIKILIGKVIDNERSIIE